MSRGKPLMAPALIVEERAANRQPRERVAEFMKQQRVALRNLLQALTGLTPEERAVVLRHHRKAARYVIRCVSQSKGIDFHAKFMMLELERFLHRAAKYPHQLVNGADMA